MHIETLWNVRDTCEHWGMACFGKIYICLPQIAIDLRKEEIPEKIIRIVEHESIHIAISLCSLSKERELDDEERIVEEMMGKV